MFMCRYPLAIFFLFIFLFFRLHHEACGILVPWPGFELVPPALGTWNLNHWTAREVPGYFLIFVYLFIFGCARSSLQHVESWVVACRLLSCSMHVGSSSPTRDWTLAPSIGSLGVLTAWPPGKSLWPFFLLDFFLIDLHELFVFVSLFFLPYPDSKNSA